MREWLKGKDRRRGFEVRRRVAVPTDPTEVFDDNLNRKFGFRDLYWNSSYRQMEGRIAVQL